MLHLDCGLILLELQLHRGWFSCKDCAHASFMEGSHIGTLYIVRFKFSFNYN